MKPSPEKEVLFNPKPNTEFPQPIEPPLNQTPMLKNIAYWVSTSIMAAMMTFSAVLYLSGAAVAVTSFAHLGYPQHLRIILGIAKLAGVITLIVPGLRLLKEWAYAGFTFAWIIACIAHWLAGDVARSITAALLLALLVVSYLTRPSSRRLSPSSI